MKTTLKTCTALTVILALTSAAGAMNNIPVPQIIRPVIVPPINVSHLAPKPQRRDRESDKNTKRTTGKREMKATPRKKAKQYQDAGGTKVENLSLPKHPPLPLPKPDFATLNDNAHEAGPQPEPPTKGMARLDGFRDRARDLALLEEHQNMRDLQETLEGKRAIDEGGIGGGSGDRGGPGFDRKSMVPEGNTKDQGPQNDRLWKPGLPGPSAYGRGLDRDQGFTPPWKSQSGERDHRGFGRTPGRAGGNLKGQRGWNANGTSCGHNCVAETRKTPESQDGTRATSTVHRFFPDAGNTEDDGDLTNGAEGAGRMGSTTTVKHADGSTTTYSTWGAFDRNGEYREISDQQVSHTLPSDMPPSDMTFTVEQAEGPDSQPAPDQPASGESMPCPKTSRGCGPSGGLMSYQPSKGDKVSQPGKGDNQGGALGFKASVAERKGVVTNPVDPENHIRGGGGRTTRPIEYVTQPGGADPDRPGA